MAYYPYFNWYPVGFVGGFVGGGGFLHVFLSERFCSGGGGWSWPFHQVGRGSGFVQPGKGGFVLVILSKEGGGASRFVQVGCGELSLNPLYV